ncbi:MAG: YidC/Oxa1 family membrane protein insertase [Candidatus Doudnabacteria bacterium]|nr:YidC/Oxa1 family membrane protein insertase [Candidatus Doudnabacteria bacterium]
MNFIKNIFAPVVKLLRPIVYVPLLNVLVFFYHYIPDLGAVIIILTILIRLLFVRSFHKSLKQQKIMQSLQPKINEIKAKYKDDKQKEMQAMMELYKENEVSPFSSCSSLLFQLPVLVALSTLFSRASSDAILHDLYSFIPHISHINPIAFGLVDLSAKNNYILVGIAAILQYAQARLTLPKQKSTDPMQNSMQTSMLYFFPVMLFVSILSLPAGLALYIIITTLFSVAQQYYIIRKDAQESL